MEVNTYFSIENLIPMNTYGVDPLGMLYTDGEKVIRVLNVSYIDVLLEYERKGIMEELARQELILPYFKAFVCIKGEKHLSLVFDYVIAIPSDQWTIQMFKDASSHLIKINKFLSQNGFGLLDANTSNLTFINSKPILIDTGSLFGTSINSKALLRSFYHSFIIPINLHAKNDFFAFSKYINTYQYPNFFLAPTHKIESSQHYFNYFDRDVSFKLEIQKGVKVLLRTSVHFRLRFIAIYLSKKIKRFNLSYDYPGLNNLIEKSSGKDEVQIDSEWKDYHTNYNSSISRFSEILELLTKHDVKINDMLDVAGNQGEFSSFMLKSEFVNKALVMDYDHESINIGYRKRRGFNGLDFLWANPFADNKVKQLSNKYKSEAVFALALTHHLILSQKINLDYLICTLVSYSKKYLIVEFMPKGLYDGSADVSVPVYYTLEWFEQVLKKYVEIIEFKEIADNRVLFLTRIKEE